MGILKKLKKAAKKVVKSPLVNPVKLIEKGSKLAKPLAKLTQKALPIVAKVAPGPIGMAAKIAGNVFNDPEWWEEYHSGGASMNLPLLSFTDTGNRGGSGASQRVPNCIAPRPYALRILSGTPYRASNGNGSTFTVPMSVTNEAVSAYLMQEVRKVLNAVTLQSVDSYKDAFLAGASLYALYQNLKRIKYEVEHAQTYMPAYNVTYPIYRTENSAALESLIKRCEDNLRGQVRLPHTLCEYLAWRYGRVYRTNAFAKSAFVLYDLPVVTARLWGSGQSETGTLQDATVEDVNTYIDTLLGVLTANAQANADLFNAYYTHDQAVHIKDETQMKYDAKEFNLRTNITLPQPSTGNVATSQDFIWYDPETVFLDSDFEAGTMFTASTVSMSPDAGTIPLFPVYCMLAEVASKPDSAYGQLALDSEDRPVYGDPIQAIYYPDSTTVSSFGNAAIYVHDPSSGDLITLLPQTQHMDVRYYAIPLITDTSADRPGTITDFVPYTMRIIRSALVITMAKALEVYNKHLYLLSVNATVSGGVLAVQPNSNRLVDMSHLSCDAGQVSPAIIQRVQLEAFANLVRANRKQSTLMKPNVEKDMQQAAAETVSEILSEDAYKVSGQDLK